MAPQKIIIDTDPGVDDIFAILLALSASPEELEVLLISLTFGNIDVENCLRNVVSLFHVLELDRQWRLENGLPDQYPSLEKFKPLVAVGADRPLEDQRIVADYFHGMDGLGGVHTTAPHYTPTELWSHIFNPSSSTTSTTTPLPVPPNFTPTSTSSHKAILSLLASHPPDTITIVAVGPLTNISLAASTDLKTFLRVKEVIIMGGAIDIEGNVTPVAEFNHYACAFSAAHIYALTSPHPETILPLSPSGAFLVDKAVQAERPLNLTIFPLDITTRHLLTEKSWKAATSPLIARGSPLASWADVFLTATFAKMREFYLDSSPETGDPTLHPNDVSLHDPMCIWYVLTSSKEWKMVEGRDIRVEPAGQWTRGMCVVNRRSKREVVEGEIMAGDEGVWLHKGYGNRVRQMTRSYDEQGFGEWLIGRIFGV